MYFKHLCPDDMEPFQKLVSISNQTEYITLDELSVVFKKRKSNKTPEEDSAISELFKY
jgi:hypothetical protein